MQNMRKTVVPCELQCHVCQVIAGFVFACNISNREEKHYSRSSRLVHQLFILLPGLALISGELHHSHLEIILAEEELK